MPVMLKAEKLQSFEVSPGTIISLTLEIAAPDILVAGVVSNDVYDAYANLAIPKGSRLIGKQMRQVNDRQEVVWNGLQIPAYGGTLRLDPPIEATMPDGTSGLVDLVAGARASAIVGHPFIVPH
ncbi:hypothetical protein PPGU16_31750 [Paraburkholderia largidicola]|uniref:Uncharacterized protein n=2 Tax=Paraburkholderia largidicola TaxID=3014751 RepID=A0A7I8BP25_9BURK|nr:hypothetical protein PPGU16_31750 [Paraburkholderia sp. PGU16]